MKYAAILVIVAAAGCSYTPGAAGQAKADADLANVAKMKDTAQTISGFLPPPFDWIVSGLAVASAGVATIAINKGKAKAAAQQSPAGA